MARSSKARLYDIVEAIAEIRAFAADLSPSLENAPTLQYSAILFSLLKITEAVRHLPDDLKQKRPDLPWRDIALTGNQLRHSYFRIKRSIVADIIQNDLPALDEAVQRFWRDLGYGDPPRFDQTN